MIKGTPKVDSCRISIPLTECQIIDTNLIDRIHTQSTNADTGEVIKENFKNGEPTVIENEDGTYLKFWKENQFFYSQGRKTPTLYITFLINSKHLGNRYFEGITTDTLKDIYTYIQSFKIVSFSFESLYNARYNDTDICIDFNSTIDQFGTLKKNIKSITTKPTMWHEARNDNNSGIWTPTKDKPRDNAKPSTPFVKFYSKHEDFTYQSISFAKTYLTPNQYEDLYRIEVTVKNSKHKEQLGISKVKYFGDFLKLDLQLLMQDIVKNYFEKKTKTILKTDNLTPMDKVVIDLLNIAILKGSTKEELYDLFNRNDVSRQARITLKEKFHKYTSLNEFNRQQMELNSTTKDVFGFLGIDIKK